MSYSSLPSVQRISLGQFVQMRQVPMWRSVAGET